jgi:hypothetical protein
MDSWYDTAAPPPLDSDADGDGYPAGEDCDDGDPFISPGARDVPYDGIDQDCDGADLTDVDGDGYDAEEVGGEDCRDGDDQIPRDEDCAAPGDEDCDGEVDEACPQVTDPADPGGMSWTCGPPLVGSGWLAAAALAVALTRRLRRPPTRHLRPR